MSTVNYSLKHKGVRLIDARDAWIVGKNGRRHLNPKYHFVGKIDTHMPNTYDLNRTAKAQIVDHFYNDKGKRNKKTVAYFGIEKGSK